MKIFFVSIKKSCTLAARNNEKKADAQKKAANKNNLKQ